MQHAEEDNDEIAFAVRSVAEAYPYHEMVYAAKYLATARAALVLAEEELASKVNANVPVPRPIVVSIVATVWSE